MTLRSDEVYICYQMRVTSGRSEWLYLYISGHGTDLHIIEDILICAFL